MLGLCVLCYDCNGCEWRSENVLRVSLWGVGSGLRQIQYMGNFILVKACLREHYSKGRRSSVMVVFTRTQELET